MDRFAKLVVWLVAGLHSLAALVGLWQAFQWGDLGSAVFISGLHVYLGVQLVRRRRHAWILSIMAFAFVFLWTSFLLVFGVVTQGKLDLAEPAHQTWLLRAGLTGGLLIVLCLPPVVRLFRSSRAGAAVR